MTDPLGLIAHGASIDPTAPASRRLTPDAGLPQTAGPGFKELLQEEIAKVNELQRDANEAAEDVVAGRRDDIEGVLLATQKADTAFRMLLQVRNKVMDAYEEVKQIRV
ncbi:MAG: flagellar hook-basal body complex protein FliE [Planctomycetes bacterium]|nr:flagellar hook-basal body complex protein FliE [Planctomycetota bacterium]